MRGSSGGNAGIDQENDSLRVCGCSFAARQFEAGDCVSQQPVLLTTLTGNAEWDSQLGESHTQLLHHNDGRKKEQNENNSPPSIRLCVNLPPGQKSSARKHHQPLTWAPTLVHADKRESG